MPAGSCKVRFDASCSGAGVASYEWTLLGPPVPAPPQVPAFTFDFAADPRCGDGNAFNRPVRLRVMDGLGRSDTVQQNVWVPQSFGAQLSVSTVTLSSRLLHPSGTETLAGWLTVDASTPLPVTSAERREYLVRVDPKGSLVEGTVQGRAPPETLWEIAIDRAGNAAFRVEAGTPVAVEGNRIVFRLSGTEGEKIRFRVEPGR